MRIFFYRAAAAGMEILLLMLAKLVLFSIAALMTAGSALAALERGDAGQGISFLRAGFPASPDEFLMRFEVTDVTDADGWDTVEVKPAGEGSSRPVRKIVLAINQKTNRPGAMQIHLRDGFWIMTRRPAFRKTAVPAPQFSDDPAGCPGKGKWGEGGEKG